MSKQANPPPPGDRPTSPAPPPPPAWRHWLLPIALLAMVLLWFVLPALHNAPNVDLSYSQFLSDVSAHKVKTVDIQQSGQATGKLTNGNDYTTVIPPQAGSSLLDQLQAAKVSITATPQGASFGSEILSWVILLLPFLVLGWLWLRLSRGAAGQLQGVLGAGRSRAKVFDAERPDTTFADVAGYEGAKAEIAEVVDFLRRPERYRRAGAATPRGVLMIGPPGTGKTLNQLLSEMDGFDPSMGIVVLAATNRPEVLDPALLRPGRFDRQITIPLPNLAERAAILAVHCRGKKLRDDVDIDVVARGTPGFSGADLANLVNEAAIFAVRAGRDVLSQADFAEARDRILLGRREGSNVLLPEEKNAVAVHEAGHAIVAALSPRADPVAKVTILPAGQTLGVTEQLPLVERHLYGEDYLQDSLAVRLAGRAAELVAFGQGSTGAANDLAQATDLAIKMVREFGLSASLGPVGYPQGGSVFLGQGGGQLSSRPFAEQTQAAIDADVARLLRHAEQRATEILTQHRDELDRLATLLVEQETVDGSVVYGLVGVPEPTGRSVGTEVAPHPRPRAAASRADSQAGSEH